MGMVSDDVLLKLATANQLSESLLSQLIAARLSEVGGALPLYDDAKAFFAPIEQQVDQILRRARQHMHLPHHLQCVDGAAVRLHAAVEAAALSSGHDLAASASLRLHRTVPAVGPRG
jgi:hypothetical protein